jgi:hypothetical protein
VVHRCGCFSYHGCQLYISPGAGASAKSRGDGARGCAKIGTAAEGRHQESAKKAVEVEGVISSVGQRTITFQTERKGNVREEVVAIDEKTNVEKAGNKVKLKELQETDKT